MNSASLQKAFPKIYQDFFAKCPIVVSAPGNFFWAGEYVSVDGGPSLTQTVPLRVYVGLEPVSHRDIRFGTDLEYNPVANAFEPKPSRTSLWHQARELIKHQTETMVGHRPTWYVLHVLSEIPSGRGIRHSGPLAAALATAVNLYYQDDFTVATVRGWKNLPTPELVAGSQFNRMFRQAWQLEALLHGGTSSGRGILASCVSSFYPLVHVSERRSNLATDHQTKKPTGIGTNYALLETVNYLAFRLDELFDLEALAYWPIDYGLIFSGSKSMSLASIQKIPYLQEELRGVVHQFTNRFRERAEAASPGASMEAFLQTDHADPWGSVVETMSTISMRMIMATEKMIRHGHTDTSLQEFFRSINQYQQLLRIIDVSTPAIDQICFQLSSRARKLDVVSGIGTKSTGGGHGGDVLFAAPSGVFRRTITDLVSELQTDYNPDIYLDYATWLDGYNEEGLLVEQHLEEKIYSPFVSQGTISVRHLNLDGDLHTDLYTIEEFIKITADDDLLLDAVHHTIVVKGERLTSTELHSATSTIEFMRVLINHPNQDVPNSQLPDSSYSRDRNELQSKIITPLTKALQKRLGKPLPVKIHGGLTDFTVRLEPSVLDIDFLEKIF